MTRKLWVLGIVAIVGASVALAGLSNTLKASACDESNKTASATHSCCAKDGAKTASVDAKKVHNSMIKSAVVAPGAAPILNIAAFGGMLAGSTSVSGCEWCPNANMTAADCAAHMSSSECAAHMSAQNASATVASNEHAGCGMSMTTAAHDGCTGAAMAMTASASCCDHDKAVKTASAGGGAGCCAEKSVSTASKEECSEAKTASLKGLVDEMPYRENKRVTLAGAYACGHCTLQKTADCSPMLKTADGKVYPLLKNSLASELKDMEGKNVQVSGTVKKTDGVKFLDVKSYKVL